MNKKPWTSFFIGLICTLIVAIICFIEPTYISCFCFGGCAVVFIDDIANLILHYIRKKNKDK